LWNKEDDIAMRLVDNLRAQNPGMIVGENEPYSLKAVNLSKNTIGTHAEGAGLPYVMVEFRQDLVKTKRDAVKWGRIFLDALAPILADPSIYHLHRARKKAVTAAKAKPETAKKTPSRKKVGKPVKKAAKKQAGKKQVGKRPK
jgi:predicted N-formylglutamate amidohydrolase